MSLKDAFDSLLGVHKRVVTISRSTGESATITVTPSNFFRNLEGPSEVTISGREFVVSARVLAQASFPYPKRGDRLEDPDLGTLVLSEVREMYDYGGSILGFRIRTS